MLWDVLFRGQLGFSLSFLEELWSRNLANLYCSPLTPLEHISGADLHVLHARDHRRAAGDAAGHPFYHFSIFTLGVPLLAFFFNLLIMGCALGLLVTAMILRFGLGGREHGLVPGLPAGAFFLRLLSGDGAARLGAGDCLCAALDPCFRGHARGALRSASSAGIILRRRWASTPCSARSGSASICSALGGHASWGCCCRLENSRHRTGICGGQGHDGDRAAARHPIAGAVRRHAAS